MIASQRSPVPPAAWNLLRYRQASTTIVSIIGSRPLAANPRFSLSCWEETMPTMTVARRFAGAMLLAIGLASPISGRAHVILLGADYLETAAPTFFAPIGQLVGLPVGPGTTDTIVQRKADCTLDLAVAGSNCQVPIELVALSLQSINPPLVLVRESPTLASSGSMTMRSSGTGSGGTFDSFFDVFVELSLDGGQSWSPLQQMQLQATGTPWTVIEPPPPALFVDGPVGDQAANRHLNKPAGSYDFYIIQVVEQHLTPISGQHTAGPAQVPEPSSAFLAPLAAVLLLRAIRRRRS
jgi:hypothetical protein